MREGEVRRVRVGCHHYGDHVDRSRGESIAAVAAAAVVVVGG